MTTTHTLPSTAPQSPKFGCELETIGCSRAAVARAILSVVGGTVHDENGDEVVVIDRRGRRWAAVHDGSLSHRVHAEIVSPILTEEDVPELQQVVRAVRNAGARVDSSTGVHIHIDGAPFDVCKVRNLVKLFHKQELLIFAAFGVSLARRGTYCKDTDADFIKALDRRAPTSRDELNALWYGRTRRRASLGKYDDTRYHALNLHSLFYRGTIEFRLFEGTLNSEEVKAYIDFVLALARKALASRAASSRKRPFDPKSAKYDFRVFLLHLGLIGDAYKSTREHLMKRLPGSAAWKNGRPEGERERARARRAKKKDDETTGEPAAEVA
jgi:hypothetical protein